MFCRVLQKFWPKERSDKGSLLLGRKIVLLLFYESFRLHLLVRGLTEGGLEPALRNVVFVCVKAKVFQRSHFFALLNFNSSK